MVSMKRPIGVTTVVWFIIVTTTIAGFALAKGFSNPEVIEVIESARFPVWLQILWSYVALIIKIVCGIYLLYGKQWARYTLSILLILGLSASALNGLYSPVMWYSITFQVGLIAILFTPNSHAWFRQQSSA